MKPFIVASKGTIAHSVYGDAQGSLEKVGIFAPHHVAIRIVAKVALPIGQLSFAHQDMVVVVGLEEGRGVPAEMQRGGFFCARIKGFVSKNYKIVEHRDRYCLSWKLSLREVKNKNRETEVVNRGFRFFVRGPLLSPSVGGRRIKKSGSSFGGLVFFSYLRRRNDSNQRLNFGIEV